MVGKRFTVFSFHTVRSLTHVCVCCMYTYSTYSYDCILTLFRYKVIFKCILDILLFVLHSKIIIIIRIIYNNKYESYKCFLL